jgi:signal transduction histidine kinase
MHATRWVTAAIAFAAIVSILVMAMLLLRRQLRDSRAEIERIALEGRSIDESVNTILLRLSEVAITSREFLMARRQESAQMRAANLRESASSLRQSLAAFSGGPPSEFRSALGTLGTTVELYLQEVEKLLDLSEEGRLEYGPALINDMIRPLRQTIRLEVDRVRAAEVARLEARRRQLDSEYDTMNRNLLQLGALMVALIGGIAIYTVVRLRFLEMKSYRQATELASNRDELRDLSQGLVAAQESERKQLSRELHDQVGQILTALRMEVGNLGDLHRVNGTAFEDRLRSAEHLGDQALQAVRDISMGLRPSMLDDLGLEPAIRWQARDFSRRTGVDVEVKIEGDLDLLPENHRIHAYRIVQESLTNIARHAKAGHAVITAHYSPTRLTITIADDGAGFDPEGKFAGAGLFGIRERVQELGGRCEVHSQPSKGTLLHVDVPLAESRVHA